MTEDGKWRLSPAYDMTYIIDAGGFLPQEDHCLYIRAKLRDFTKEDVLLFAKDNGIRRPYTIIRHIATTLKQFRSIAANNGVPEQWIGRVETTIFNHLKSWGEMTTDEQTPAITLHGHTVSHIQIVAIDGQERKFVIGKNKKAFSLIEKTGISNLSQEQLTSLVETCFKL